MAVLPQRLPRCRADAALVVVALLVSISASAQSLRMPWTGYSHDAQHTSLSPTASQSLDRILWQTRIDLTVSPTNTGFLPIHYGSPSITRSNTVLVPVRAGLKLYEIKALAGATGSTNWERLSDYSQPPHGWALSFSGVLTPKNRFYFPGGGGTLYFCDTPDTNGTPVINQVVFYGLTNYLANTNSYLTNVFVSTPITSDRYGNIFFGFQVNGTTPVGLQSGIARIDVNGNSTWAAAADLAGDATIKKVAQNCAPALSNDHKVLYAGVNTSPTWAQTTDGYLVAVDSRTLAPLNSVRLRDVKTSANNASLSDNGTASPTIGPDGDVYYGMVENPVPSNNDRGWLLHFDSTLAHSRIPGAFGWDDTPSIVPASLVPSYHGTSPYLLMVKYNNYAGIGTGDGVNKIALLDPKNSMTDPITGATVMKEVISIAGPTPDAAKTNTYPNAVREWCINSAVVDLRTRSVLANNEDGKMYRWDLTSNTFSQTNVLTTGVGEAYTPTLIGIDGAVYGINNAILFVIGH